MLLRFLEGIHDFAPLDRARITDQIEIISPCAAEMVTPAEVTCAQQQAHLQLPG